ncbi:MAG: TolC family protein [Candidatus Kapaibacterium sp.]|nr:MAG: TolC family protein [Candidatus Kapabacteria bacterium]
MMMSNWSAKCIAFFLLLILCGIHSALCAQPLDSLLSEAMRNNPQLRAYSFTVQAAEHRTHAAGALPPPQAGVTVEQVQVGNFNIVNGALSNNFYASQMFMLGGKLSAMQDMERARVKNEQDRSQEFAAKLRSDITTVYTMLWRIDRQREIYASTATVLERSIEVASSQVQTGRFSYAEVLRLQAEKSLALLKQKTLSNERKTALAMLAALLGRANATSLNITPVLLDERLLSETNVRERLQTLAASNPTLRRMASMITMTEAERISAEKGSIPDVMLQGMIMRMPQGMTLTANSSLFTGALESPFEYIIRAPNAPPDWMYSLMAQITLPFAPWSAPKYTAKAQELAAISQAQTLERENMTLMLSAQMEEQLQKMQTATETVEILKSTVIPLYERTFDAQLAGLQSGQTSISGLLDTERMLLMKRDDVLMAREQYYLARAQLEFLLGESLR